MKIEDMPYVVKDSLFKSFDNCSETEIKTKVDLFKLKKSVESVFVYDLRMYWQTRFDKMNSVTKKSMETVSELFLPKEFNFKPLEYGDRLNTELDQTKLATEIFNKLWAIYETKPQFNRILKENKKSVFKKLFGMS